MNITRYIGRVILYRVNCVTFKMSVLQLNYKHTDVF